MEIHSDLVVRLILCSGIIIHCLNRWKETGDFWAYLYLLVTLYFGEINLKGSQWELLHCTKVSFDWSESSPKKWYCKPKITASADLFTLCIRHKGKWWRKQGIFSPWCMWPTKPIRNVNLLNSRSATFICSSFWSSESVAHIAHNSEVVWSHKQIHNTIHAVREERGQRDGTSLILNLNSDLGKRKHSVREPLYIQALQNAYSKFAFALS